METTNTAKTLLRIVAAAQNVDGGVSISQGWAVILHVDLKEPAALFRALAELGDLVREVKHKVESIDNLNYQIFLKQFPKLDRALTHTDLATNWSAIKNCFDDSVVTTLEFCDAAFDDAGRTAKADVDEITILIQQVQTLINEVRESELDRKFKVFLLTQLHQMFYALTRYEATGPFGVNRELSRVVGEVVLNPQYKKQLEHTKEGSSFKKVLTSALLAISVAAAGEKLLADTVRDVAALISDKTPTAAAANE